MSHFYAGCRERISSEANQKPNLLFSTAVKKQIARQWLLLACLLVAITTGSSQRALAQCTNTSFYPQQTISAPAKGTGPYAIAGDQYQQEYNQMTDAVAGNTFQSTASIAGTWITVRAGTAPGPVVAQGSTPLNWTAAAGGSYFIHYNTNSACGTASNEMSTTIENTSVICAALYQYPLAAFSAPAKGAGPYTIVNGQYQKEYNQMTGAVAGSTFQSKASIAGTWITVRAGTASGLVVAEGTTPLDWTATSGGTYFIHYHTNSACGIANIEMATTIEYTAPKPTISSFTPLIGNPGTLVTIAGADLDVASAVTIGGVPAIVVSKTSTSAVAMVMPGATTGSVSVGNGAGTSTAAGSFTVTATPYPMAQQGNKLVGSGNVGASQQGQSIAVSADGNTAIVGGKADNGFNGAAWIYTRSGGVWTQQGTKLIGTGNIGIAQQGVSVALSADGNTAIVGGDRDNSFAGAAWVFTRSGSTWTQQGAKLVGTGAIGSQPASQGHSVSLSADGNTAIVGGFGDNSFAGATWVFTRSGGVWTQQGTKLVGTGAVGIALQDRSALSADGNTIIVGGSNDNNSVGAAWIFTRSGSSWTQQSKLVGTGAEGLAKQGHSVSLSADGNTAVVGGYTDNNFAGAAWVWTRSSGTWTQRSKLVGSGAAGSANQGISVTLSADGNTAMLGGYVDNNEIGAVWVFTRSGDTWIQQRSKLVGTLASTSARQGTSVSLSADGNTAITGGPFDNGSVGAAWVFAAIPDPGVIGNAHTVVRPQERNPDYVTNVRSASNIWGNSYIWQSSANGVDNWVTTTQTAAQYILPELTTNTYFRRGLSGAFGSVWSNTIQIKVLAPNGTIAGKVTSFSGGTGVKGVTIRIRKILDLPGSPKEFVYSTVTGNDGTYSVPVYYGDKFELDPNGNTNISTQFKVVASKPGNPVAFDDTVKTPTLSNLSPNNLTVDFVDKSGYNITGRIFQTCNGCLNSSGNPATITSNLNEVSLYRNGLFEMKSTFLNGIYGSWASNVPSQGSYRIRPFMQGRKFVPDSSTVTINTLNVSNVDFEDTTTRVISGRIGDGCQYQIGEATLEFIDVLRNNAGQFRNSEFRKRVSTVNGIYSVRLPARLYKVTVFSFTPALIPPPGGEVASSDFMPFFNTNKDNDTLKTAMPYDSLLADISNSNKTLNLWYRRAPQMVLENLDKEICTTKSGAQVPQDFIVFPQSQPKAYQVKVYQGNPAGLCPVKDDTVTVYTNLQQDDQNETRVLLTQNGIAYDTLIGGVPNLIKEINFFKKAFTVSFTDQFQRAATNLSPKVVVTGVKADNASSFATVSPEVPIMILHDPAGDGSYSYWQTDQTIEQATSWSVSNGESSSEWAEVKLGVKFEAGLGVTTESAFWGQVNGSVDVNTKTVNSSEFISSTTTSQVISTSSDEDITGDRGDLFIGAAMNLLYTRCFELKFNNQCILDTSKKLMIAQNGFATQYVYTDGAIRENVIPTLREFAKNDTSVAGKNRYLNQVKVWEQVLANNEANKRRAALDKNISFFGSSGAIENSTKTSSSSTSTLEFDMEVDEALAVELGLEVGGSGASAGYNLHFRTETGKSKSNTNTKETTIGYVLDDNDALDNFSINVKKDPVYNTPVFQTVAGQTSCPPEDFTLARDEPQLVVAQPVVTAAATTDAVFQLVLGNLSVDASPRTYNLSFDQASNPFGATVSIGGIPMGLLPIPYAIGSMGAVQVTVNVKRNLANNTFTYEGLKFILSDACSGEIVKTALLTARFQAACDPLTLASPQEGWLTNKGANNSIAVTFKDYNLALVQQVALEYMSVNTSSWSTGFTRTAAELNNSSNGTLVNWDVSTLADGEYYLRMRMTCSGGLVYTQRVKGRIDRSGPVVFGTPQPSDYNYSVGDEISFSYNENINTQNLNQGIVSLVRLSTQGLIPVSVTGFGNKLMVVSQNNLSVYSGESLRLVVKDVEDLYGNKKAKYDTLVFSVGTFVAATGDNALQIATTTPAKMEGSATPVVYTFSLPKKPANDVQINFLAGGTALYGADYSVGYSSTSPLNSFDGSRGTIIFPKNQLSVTLKVYPKLDAQQESDETIILSLSEGGDYRIGSSYSAEGTIQDNTLAAPTITGSAQFCQGSSSVLTANHPQAGTSGYSFLWSNGATTQSISASQAGLYTVKIKNATTGAEGTSAGFTLSIYSLPTVKAGADTAFAQGGGNYTLGGSPTGGNWSGIGVGGNTFNRNLVAGTYPVYYCVTTAQGCSKCDTLVITLLNIPIINSSFTGPNGVCRSKTGIEYSIPASPGAASYLWTLPAGMMGSSTTNSITVATSSTFAGGTIQVRAVNSVGTSSAALITVTAVTALPLAPASLTGSASVCLGSTETYECAEVIGATYTWTAPANANIVNGQGTKMVTVAFSDAYTTGSLSVKATNCFGTSTLLKALTVSKKVVPATPGVISGINGFCVPSTQTFSIAAVANAIDYFWTAPANASIVSQSGTSVTVSFTSAYSSGSLSVMAGNCSGISTARTLAVRIKALPATPGVITGVTAGACSVERRTYSILALSNTDSYEWTAPANASIYSGQGTNSVVLEFAASFTTGTLSVKGVNCSGNSVTPRTLALTKVTAALTVLTGPATAVCAGSTQTYSTTAVAGATSYTWTVPTGAVINSGQGSTSISVTFPSPFTSGAVTVKSGTACYSSLAKAINVYSIPLAAASITGNAVGVCGGSTQTYSCPVSTTGATSYNWTVPTGAVINSGLGSNSISVTLPAVFASGNVSVTTSNTCGVSVAKTLAVRSTTAQPGVITGASTNLCSGGSFTYSIVVVTGVSSYSWTAPAGCTITVNTGNSITMTVPAGFVSGTLSVIAVNGCGNSVARTLALSGVPVAPASINGPASVCPSATGLVYSTPVVAGVSTYTWTVPTGASITSGQNTSSITANWGPVAGSVTVKAGNACGTFATGKALAVTLSIACREAVAEVVEAVNLYPNPAVNSATLNFTSAKDSDYQIRVINALGQSVYSGEGKATQGANTLELNLEKLSSGLYIVQLVKEGSRQQVNLIKK